MNVALHKLRALLLAPLVWSLSCAASGAPPYSPGEQQDMLSAIMAQRIEVLGPFCRPTSFDKDPIPDGIEAVVGAYDTQGEPTKLAGQMVFELYVHRPAAADPKGQQVQTWRLALAGVEDQKQYWNDASRCYEFPLEVNAGALPRSSKFVLLARYSNPWNEQLESEAVIDLAGLISELKEQIRSSR